MKKSEIDSGQEGNGADQERDGSAKAKELKEIVEPIIHSGKPDSEKVSDLVRTIGIWEEYSGPLPQPYMLEGYEKILPGAADRIFSMAEKEQAHRHEFLDRQQQLDSKELDGILRANRTSQIFAFVLVIILIAVGGVATYFGQIAVGITIFGTTIISVASTFIVGFVKDRNRSVARGNSDE